VTERITPAAAVAHLAPDFFESLTDRERAVIAHMPELWLRPEQQIPPYAWRYYGFMCGRGFGKSFAIAHHVNRRVADGSAHALALMAPTDDRVDEVQIEFLIATSPPWFKAERYRGGVVWPNGVHAVTFTPEAPGRPRSGNFDLTWLCELVDWQATTRFEAFKNITTATRVGRCPQVIWDTTSRGQNDVIQHLKDLNKSDPGQYPIVRGAMFDNPLLTEAYIRAECRKYTGREFDEEIGGLSFDEAAGARFQKQWLDDYRVLRTPDLVQCLLAIDPALSGTRDADEIGMCEGGYDARGDVYVTHDHSKRMPPEEWGALAVSRCIEGPCSGVIIERNHLGDNAAFVIKAAATTRNVTVRTLERMGSAEAKEFPRRVPGVIYVREVVAAESKAARAGGPAAETEAGRVHLVGRFPALELELTTYEPGTRRSPNRYDAHNYLIIELRGLHLEAPPDPRADVRGAVAAHDALARKLRTMGRGRRVGL
jgi:phage terminase large subunit-like protein